jgi:hypothetical protein
VTTPVIENCELERITGFDRFRSRQSFRPHPQGNKSLARGTARGPLRIDLHHEAWLSWLNLVEGFFSKLARSVLRYIRVASKQELEDRILAAIDDINRQPVLHTWAYQLDEIA